MRLEQSFEVQAPVDRVWAALVDVERVAPCLPGAAVTGRNEDGSYSGTFTVKIGPTTASYTGKIEMKNLDESTYRATMHAQGADKRGQGGATATISSKLSPLDDRTLVQVETDYHITGRLARFGRGGMIEDISERLLREFAGRLQASLTYSGGGGPEAGPVEEAAPPEPPPPTETTHVGTEEFDAVEAQDEGDSEQPTTESPRVPWEAAPPEAEPAPEAEPVPEPEPTPEPEAVPEPEPPAAPEPPPPPPEPAPPPEPPPPPPPPPPTEPAPPIEGVSLVGSVLVERIKRNPAPLVGVIGGLVVLRLLTRRR